VHVWKASKTKSSSVARGRQAPDDARLVSIVFYLLVLTRWRHYLALLTSYRLDLANFAYPPLIYCFCLGWPPSNLWKTWKSFTVSETRVFRAADGENLVILAWTVFAWSTRVTDRRTELRWLRRAIAVPAVARKNELRRIVRDSHGEAAQEILSIEHSFRWFNTRFFRFKETCAWGH